MIVSNFPMLRQLRMFFVLILFPLFGLVFYANAKHPAPKVLLFYKHVTFYHTSIPVGVEAIMKMAKEKNVQIDTTNHDAFFASAKFMDYDAVIFLNTADSKGELLSDESKIGLQKFIRAGKGFVGIHAASDAGYEWAWYQELVGATFKSHPKQQNAKLIITDATFTATKHLPSEWVRFDEWYNFKNTHWDKMNILLTIDETSYAGGENEGYHPMSWYHSFEGGRSFYTALGHTEESWKEDAFLKHIWGGIQYAIHGK